MHTPKRTIITVVYAGTTHYRYGLASVSMLDKGIGFFFRILSLLQGSFAKETCDLKKPTNHSHPLCVAWLIDMRGTTRSYVKHDLFLCVAWLIHMCDTTHPFTVPSVCVQRVQCRHMTRWFTCVTRLIYTCDMTHWYVWNDSPMHNTKCVCAARSILTYDTLIHMAHATVSRIDEIIGLFCRISSLFIGSIGLFCRISSLE